MSLEDNAHEFDDGLIINNTQNGENSPLLTGGESSPVGLSSELNTIYFQKKNNRIRVWEKITANANKWVAAIFPHIHRRFFIQDEVIEVEQNTTLQMHSPTVDGELIIDGEVYIL